MIQLALIPSEGKLIPQHSSDLAILNTFKEGEAVWASVWKPRNLKLHNKFFALLRMFVTQTSDSRFQPLGPHAAHEASAIERFRKALMYELNLVDKAYDFKGEAHILPRSIAFHKMDDAEFIRDVYDPTIIVIAKLLGVAPEDVEAMAPEYL